MKDTLPSVARALGANKRWGVVAVQILVGEFGVPLSLRWSRDLAGAFKGTVSQRSSGGVNMDRRGDRNAKDAETQKAAEKG